MADYEIITSGKVGGGGSTQTLSLTSIPGTFKHLELMVHCRSTRTSDSSDPMNFRLNNDSSSSYGSGQIYALNAGSGSISSVRREQMGYRDAFQEAFWAPANYSGADNNNFGYFRALFLGYSQTTLTKTMLIECSVAGALNPFSGSVTQYGLFAQLGCFGWNNTAAITQIDLPMSVGNWNAESTYILAGLS
tara:strand:+ start:1808 stop:2380 length:573 start_codon:yes stop_codon:yes gene_type:complete